MADCESSRLTQKQKEIYIAIAKGVFTDKDFRETSEKALCTCEQEDFACISDCAEEIVRYVKSVSSKTQLSIEGAVELLAAVGRVLLITEDNNDGDEKIEKERRNAKRPEYISIE